MKEMNKIHRVEVRLKHDDYVNLMNHVEQSGMTREEYIRHLFRYILPKGKPTEDYSLVLTQLKRIGNNINQITVIAHQTKSIDIVRLKEELLKLEKVTAEIKMIASQPYHVREKDNGNNEDMGC